MFLRYCLKRSESFLNDIFITGISSLMLEY